MCADKLVREGEVLVVFVFRNERTLCDTDRFLDKL